MIIFSSAFPSRAFPAPRPPRAMPRATFARLPVEREKKNNRLIIARANKNGKSCQWVGPWGGASSYENFLSNRPGRSFNSKFFNKVPKFSL